MIEIMLEYAPADWPRKRLGQLFRERREKVSDKDFPPLSVTKQGILPQLDTAAKTDDGDNRKGVRAGDFVINSRSDRKGSAGLSDRDGSVSLINIVLQPRDVEPRFAHHLLRSTAFQEEFYRLGHGIVADLWTTRYSEMKNILLAVPGIPTQKAIADFLDRETALIDQLIKKKQRLVELLAERSLSTIEDAISSESQTSKLGHHVKILSGYAFASSAFSSSEKDVRLLRGANVAPGNIRWEDVVYWPRDKTKDLERFQLKKSDIVVGMDRPWISGGIRVAELAQHDVPALLLQRVCKITPMNTLYKEFLKLLLSSKKFLGYFEPELTGVSVPHISGDQIAGFRFSYFSVPQQVDRAKACKRILGFNESIISMVRQSIENLREYRSTLITAFVTGQVDIAAWSKRGETDRHLDKIEKDLATQHTAGQMEARA